VRLPDRFTAATGPSVSALAEAAEVLKQEPGRDFERTVSTDSRCRVELAKACGVAVSPKENGPRERPVSV
jgi:hypothetical protein